MQAKDLIMKFIKDFIGRVSETVHERLQKKFLKALYSIKSLLADAQEKQITDDVVKEWLDDIQDALFQAEDLLDEIHHKERQFQVQSGSGSRISNMIQIFFSSLLTFDREDRIQDFVENLKRIFGKIKQLEKEGLNLGLRKSIIEEELGNDLPYSLDEDLLYFVHALIGRPYDSGDDGRDSSNLSDMKSRYHEFPLGLKRCFLYCEVFPKNYFFKKEELVLLWLANGFLHNPFGLRNKEVGCYYFQKLVDSSFFVQSSDHSSSFKINDLIYDWVKLISRNYSVSLDDGDSFFIKARHLWCSNIERYEDLESLVRVDDGAQMLGAILPISNESFWKDVNDEKVHSLLSIFKHLRILRLFNIQELPDSIGTMTHLRYLNLSGAAIKRLPEPVCSLFNLQILILRQCRDLVELPANIVNLTDLCHLDIRETRVQQMPPHISKLRKLELLTDFFVGEQTGCRIKELGRLWFLKGELHIRNLQNVSDAQDASHAYLRTKKFKKLGLSWSGSNADDSLLQQEVLEELKPDAHTVERLSIIGYGGKEFSSWIRQVSFSNIVDLKLSECQFCSSLPPLDQLQALETLVVQAFYKVEKVDREFYGSSSSANPFPALKNLTFERMLQWREWESYAGDNENIAFPCLEVLCIIKCPNLTKNLPSHLTSLKKLEITKCQRLELPSPQLPPIHKLVLGDDFHKLLLDHHLQSLAVDSFHSSDSILEEIRRWGYSCATLQKIEITRSPLKSFPLRFLPALKQLDISRCANLESLCAQHLTCLEELKISECPKLKSMPEESLPSSLISLSIQSCQLLEQRCQQRGEDWHKISRIPNILIGGCKIKSEF